MHYLEKDLALLCKFVCKESYFYFCFYLSAS